MPPPGSFAGDIDLIQILLVAFALYFAGLVIYLRREDKREGYPLLVARNRPLTIIGWPAPPPPKTFRLMDGGVSRAPHLRPQPSIDAAVLGNGMPIPWSGDPLLSGLGAGAYVVRSNAPMRTIDGDVLLKPLRNAAFWTIRRGESDPRGMAVVGSDFERAGTVADVWVDRAAGLLRYLEVTPTSGPGTVIVPIYQCAVDLREGEVRVLSLKAAQFSLVPRLADPDLMTAREEDRINAFHAGGTLYADPYPLP